MARFVWKYILKDNWLRIFVLLTILGACCVFIAHYQKSVSIIYIDLEEDGTELTEAKQKFHLQLKNWVTHAESLWEDKTVQRNLKLLNNPSIMNGNEGDIVQFYHLFKATYNCPFKVERVGRAGDGGKWICGVAEMSKSYRESPCVLYSFGVNDDSSFEAELMEKVNCTVFAYDPTVSKIAAPLNSSDPRVKFEKLGLSSVDDVRRGYRTLKAIMKQNGHKWIDILKMDVEGYEFDSLLNVSEDFPKLLPFGQLLFEAHVWKQEYRPKFVKMFDELEQRGMRAYYYEPNPNLRVGCEYSFFNIKVITNYFDQVEQ